MDEKFHQAVRQLTKKYFCSSSSTVYNALVVIRTKYMKDNANVADFRRLGGLQAIIHHLQKPNLKIANVALSILGNCCMEPKSRIVVRKLGGIIHVVNLLESLGENDLQNRACRVLANLALDVASGNEILEKNGARLIIDTLSTSKDEHTKVSALRAIRLLATTPKQRQDIVERKGVESICKLLILEENATKETILLYILKALASLTIDCSLECSRQLQNVQYAEKLTTFLLSPSEVTTTFALQALSNMSRHETIRPLLGSAGAVPLLIAHVAKWERTSIGWQHAVIALCQCTKEAVNRVRFREGDGLVHLIGLLGDHEDERLWPCALAAIINFLFDSESFTLLVELGLVTRLVERFRQLIAGHNRRKHDFDPALSKNAKSPDSHSVGDVDHGICPPSRKVFPDWVSSDCRTSSASSPGQCHSPEVSPPYGNSLGTVVGGHHLGSPVALSPPRAGPSSCSSSSSIEHRSDAAGNLCYSPVYDDGSDEEDSDVGDASATTMVSEEEGAGESPTVDTSPGATPPDFLTFDDQEDQMRLRSDGEVATPLGDILLLLSRISMQEDPRLSFISCGAFVAVYEYVASTLNPIGRAWRMLLRILRNPLYFECLLLHRIPQYLYKRLSEVEHPVSACLACNLETNLSRQLITNLCLQAESAFGNGVIEHMLVGKTEPDLKLLAITAANLLLKSNRSRRKMYLESTCLFSLCQWLETVEHPGYDEFISSVMQLGRSLLHQIAIPIPEMDPEWSYVGQGPECRYVTMRATSNHTDDVLLVAQQSPSSIDDSNSASPDGILISRSFASRRCDVFRAMLSGSFSETSATSISIGDASFDGLGYAVHHLHGCQMLTCPVMRDSADAATLMATLAIADRFLLTDLKLIIAGQLTRCIKLISFDEWTEVLLTARLSNCPELVRWIYVDVLTAESSDLADKRNRLRRWMSCEHSGEIAAELQSLLHEALTVRCSVGETIRSPREVLAFHNFAQLIQQADFAQL